MLKTILASAVAGAALLSGCALMEPPLPAEPTRGNATVRAIAYYEAATAKATPAAAATPTKERRTARDAKRSTAKAQPAAARSVAAAQERYEYTVELDAGGFKTISSAQDHGLAVYDRVQVEGSTLAAVRD